MLFYVLFFVFIIFVGIFLIFKFKKTYKISVNRKSFFLKQLKKIDLETSYKHKIIDYDKLYHKILLEAGYNGSFGEILKQKPSEILNLDKIWELHKLRNKLVHDFDLVSETVLKSKSLDYKNEVNKLITQFRG